MISRKKIILVKENALFFYFHHISIIYIHKFFLIIGQVIEQNGFSKIDLPENNKMSTLLYHNIDEPIIDSSKRGYVFIFK